MSREKFEAAVYGPNRDVTQNVVMDNFFEINGSFKKNKTYTYDAQLNTLILTVLFDGTYCYGFIHNLSVNENARGTYDKQNYLKTKKDLNFIVEMARRLGVQILFNTASDKQYYQTMKELNFKDKKIFKSNHNNYKVIVYWQLLNQTNRLAKKLSPYCLSQLERDNQDFDQPIKRKKTKLYLLGVINWPSCCATDLATSMYRKLPKAAKEKLNIDIYGGGRSHSYIGPCTKEDAAVYRQKKVSMTFLGKLGKKRMYLYHFPKEEWAPTKV